MKNRILFGLFLSAIVVISAMAAVYQNKFVSHADPESIGWTNTATAGITATVKLVGGSTNAASQSTNMNTAIINPIDGSGVIGGRLGSGFLWSSIGAGSVWGFTTGSFLTPTNWYGNGTSNYLGGLLNVASNITIQGTYTGNGAGITNLPTTGGRWIINTNGSGTNLNIWTGLTVNSGGIIGDGSVVTNIAGTNFSSGTATLSNTNMNFVIGNIYQTVVLGTNCNVTNISGVGVGSLKILPGGGNRTISFPTNWCWLGQTNGLAAVGSLYSITLTNGLSRIGWLSVATSGTDPTNVTAAYQQSP